VFSSANTTPTSLAFTPAINRKWVKITATGLTPDTQYYYGIKDVVAGITDTKTGMAKTTPAPLTASSYKLLLSGDCDVDGLSFPGKPEQQNVPIFHDMAEFENDYLAFLHLGDFIYSNDDTTDQAKKRDSLYRTIRLPETQKVFRKYPLIYTYDDHDSGPNDHHMAIANFSNYVAEHIQAYKDIFPHYPMTTLNTGAGWVDGLGQIFTLGRVRYVMPDTRAFASVGNTVLGDGGTYSSLQTKNQKQAVKDAMIQAKTDGIKLVVFLTSRSTTGLIGHTWEDQYLTELNEMIQYFADADMPEIVIIMADAHQLGFDDGQSGATRFYSDAKFPTLICGPLKADSFTYSGRS
jgi:phosphodiesterase/alkaline phosphatase D-like protein